jgi:hypothetical protein
LKLKKPVSALFKPVKVDFKDLFKALAKGVGHTATGKWIELGGDAVETLSALGLASLISSQTTRERGEALLPLLAVVS